MRNLNSNAILFNISGGAILVTVAAYMGYGFFRNDQVSQCAARYPAGKQFAFDDKAGELLTPMELQGRVGSREWGLLKNARIVSSADASKTASLEVDLAASGDEDSPGRNGVGFAWQSPELAKATSACLSYKILLPEGFGFAERGYLPGLYGAPNLADLDAEMPESGFAARVAWGKGGDAGTEISGTDGNIWNGGHDVWPRGRWIPVEQEIVLNAPGAENGTLRMWVDGKLQVENRAVRFQSHAAPGLSGVVADIGYANNAGGPAALKLSPFVVQWR